MNEEVEAVDAEVLGDRNETYRDLVEWEKAHKNWFMFSRVFLLVVTLLGIATSILIMHVIIKFPKLRIRINFYIFHMLLCNLIYSVFQSLFISAFCILYDTNYIPIEIMRVLWNLDETAWMLIFIYCLALIFDWYAHIYNKELLIRYQQKYYKFAICLLYLLAILKICLHFTIRIGFMDIIMSVYFVLFIIVTLCNCWRCCGKYNEDEEPAYNVQVVNAIVYSCLPLMIYILLDHVIERRRFMEKFILATIVLAQVVISLIPVTVFLVLRRRDNLFRAAFDIALHRKGHDYENSQLHLCDEEKV